MPSTNSVTKDWVLSCLSLYTPQAAVVASSEGRGEAGGRVDLLRAGPEYPLGQRTEQPCSQVDGVQAGQTDDDAEQ
jgi:hypothetical protein